MREEIYKNAISEARQLMYEKTLENKAPSWIITELAQEVGKELSREYNVDQNIVLLTLYLQHLVFDSEIGGEIQKNHPELSANYVLKEKLLEKWNIPEEDRPIIIEAIRTHHQKTKSDNLIVEVIKNAECQKFVTVRGSLIWLHELGLRGYNFDKSKEYVFYKMNQKKELLTLDKCKEFGDISCNRIINMFENPDIKSKLIKLHSLGLEKVDFDRAMIEAGLESI